MSTRNRTGKTRTSTIRRKPTASNTSTPRTRRTKSGDSLSIVRDVLILVLLFVVGFLSVAMYDFYAESQLTGKIGYQLTTWLVNWIGDAATLLLIPLILFLGFELLLPIRTNWRAKLTLFMFITFIFLPLILGLIPNLSGGGMIGKLCCDFAINNIGAWGYGLILGFLYLIGITFALGNQWVAPALYSAHEASATGLDAVKKGAGITGKAVVSGIKKVNENITDIHSKWASERDLRTEQLRKKVEDRQRQIDGIDPEPIVIKPEPVATKEDFVTPSIDLLNKDLEVEKPASTLVELQDTSEDVPANLPPERKIAVGEFGDNPERELVFDHSTDPRDYPESLFAGRSYTLPSIDMLAEAPSSTSKPGDLQQRAYIIEATLKSFGIPSQVVHIQEGPRVTRFELTIGRGVNVSKVHNLSDNLALDLAVGSVRIEAPIPGKSAIGIEVPNVQSKLITIRSVLADAQRELGDDPLVVALGKDIAGKSISGHLGKFPHLLIAGATGSGKSVCINALIISLLMRSRPEQLRLIMVDPKYVELTQYRDIPHLLCPVLTEVKEVQAALNWTVGEMTRRYKIFAEIGARKLDDFNDQVVEQERMPYIVMIIDELADLMMMAGPVIEKLICRIAQKARATGIHLVVATQRPDVKVITGTIKANIPSRIAFATVSQVDSRTILDGVGAEKLLGSGDMLYHPIGASKAIRVQGCYVSDREIDAVTEFIRNQAPPDYDDDVLSALENAIDEDQDWDAANPEDVDDLYNDAKKIMLNAKRPSISLLQRRLGIGYNRAARIMEQMEAHGVVTAPDSRGDRKLAE